MKKGLLVFMAILILASITLSACGSKCPHGVCEKPEGVEQEKE